MKSMAIACAALLVWAGAAGADNTYQTLPLTQEWSDAGMLTVTDNWSGVPGIIGYLGDNATYTYGGRDARTCTADSLGAVDVNVNQVNPNTYTTGGVAEFAIADPVVALQGSNTADYPSLVFHVDATGMENIYFSCDLRDVDGGTDNSIQQINLQYRIGASGVWTNVAGGYVADASVGPSLTQTLAFGAMLPADVTNAAQLQIRVLTTNAVGNDEWIGIDNINITGEPVSVPTEQATWGSVKTQY